VDGAPGAVVTFGDGAAGECAAGDGAAGEEAIVGEGRGVPAGGVPVTAPVVRGASLDDGVRALQPTVTTVTAMKRAVAAIECFMIRCSVQAGA
jgi:hypothetical protein